MGCPPYLMNQLEFLEYFGHEKNKKNMNVNKCGRVKCIVYNEYYCTLELVKLLPTFITTQGIFIQVVHWIHRSPRISAMTVIHNKNSVFAFRVDALGRVSGDGIATLWGWLAAMLVGTTVYSGVEQSVSCCRRGITYCRSACVSEYLHVLFVFLM